ncbi:MAG: phospholipid-binding domain-containing protein [Alphaproteobacteria bacterium]|nr:MAG: phospholipid-binding domain-containing protein [Alphaproteobacteria bacterium]
MKHYVILSLAASGLLLSSCSPVGLAAGVGVGVGTAVVQEGGISRAASDLRIQTEINDLWFRYNISMFTKLDLTINQGRVLITGVVQNPDHRVEAVRMAWQPRGVVHVMNEIKVAKSAGIIGYAKDAWISTRLRAALVMASEVESINYSIDTVQGSVYLMGFAQNQVELNQVIETARTIENVKQVVSYVKLVGTPELAPVSQPQGEAPVIAPDAAATGEPIQWNQNSVYD